MSHNSQPGFFVSWSDVASAAAYIERSYGMRVRVLICGDGANLTWNGQRFRVYVSCDRHTTDHSVPVGTATFGARGTYESATAAINVALLDFQEELEKFLKAAAESQPPSLPGLNG